MRPATGTLGLVRFLDQLERRWGGWCIPGLLRIVAIAQAILFVAVKFNPGLYPHLQLVPEAVLAGEVWRIVSFIFLPPTLSFIWIFFAVMFLVMIGDILETAWGSFRLNLYYFTCVLLLNIVAFLTGGSGMEATLLYQSLLLAACVVAPEVEILLFFILPVKLKFLGLFTGASMVYVALLAPSIWPAVIAVLIPFLCFAGPSALALVRHRSEVAGRRKRFQQAQLNESDAFHTCSRCGLTDKRDPHTDFRIAPDGQEYCANCLSDPARRNG